LTVCDGVVWEHDYPRPRIAIENGKEFRAQALQSLRHFCHYRHL